MRTTLDITPHLDTCSETGRVMELGTEVRNVVLVEHLIDGLTNWYKLPFSVPCDVLDIILQLPVQCFVTLVGKT